MGSTRFRKPKSSVLDTDTRYYEAQINLAQAQLDERLALVQLY
jgi:hypothetical protein